MTKNILQLLEKTAQKDPSNIAFSDVDGQVTYGEAVERARAIGSRIGQLSCTHSAVAVVMDKSKEELVGFMGVVYSGNFYVPIDTAMPENRVLSILNTVKPVAILADAKNMEKVQKWNTGISVISYEESACGAVDEALLTHVRRRAIDTDPVYALFTSGSTGVPKGVVVCHRSVIDYSDWLVETFHLNENTVFGSQAPFYFSMSVLDIYATIGSGATLHVIPRNLFMFPVRLIEHMNEYKINTIYWVPSALSMISNTNAMEVCLPEYLETVLFAGETMPTKQLNIWRKHLPDVLYANLFGPTEITDIGVYYIVDREFADDEPLPIGKACDNVDLIVLNDDNTETEIGQMGELCVRGSFLAHGYYDNPEKTAEVFIQNPLQKHYPELIYKTGDLVSYNERFELLYHGRKDFQIKHHGNRIELGEIETAVSAVENMELCACIYDTEKEKIVLFYQGKDVTAKDIRKGVQNKIPAYMMPNVMNCLEQMPMNMNGKIDRKELKRIYEEA